MAQRRRKRHSVLDPVFTKSIGEVMEAAANRGAQAAPGGDGAAYEMAPDMPTASGVPYQPAPQPEPQWPISIKEFRQGGYLQSGDIVLTTKLGSFFAFLLRNIDHSSFAHSALVFLTPHAELGVEENYVIEATMGGVDLGAFGEFAEPTKIYPDTKKPPSYVVGIKRLEHSWVTPQIRSMAAGRMLRFLDVDDYDYSMLAALASRHTHFWFKVRDFLFGRAPSLGEYLRRGLRYAPAEFICSGFVQFAFVDMVRTALERGLIAPEKAEATWRDVLFASWVEEDTTMEDLMGVRPRELAESDKLEWKYLIYGGQVHKVGSIEEVNTLFCSIKAQIKQESAAEA